MRNELELERNIQRSMLPDVFPRLPWAAVHASLEMCREVCGDLHDCFVPDPAVPDRLCCVMGDVCGKGVPAAIIMSRTMSLARDGTFTWASAGHPPPLPCPEPEGEGFASDAVRPPAWPGELVLGVRDGQRYSTFQTRLAPGQSLLLYTDGADEAQAPPASGNAGGELYGEARLAGSFDRACRAVDPTAGPETIVARLRQDLTGHMDGRPAGDDISLMVVTRSRQGEADTASEPEPSHAPDRS